MHVQVLLVQYYTVLTSTIQTLAAGNMYTVDMNLGWLCVTIIKALNASCALPDLCVQMTASVLHMTGSRPSS